MQSDQNTEFLWDFCADGVVLHDDSSNPDLVLKKCCYQTQVGWLNREILLLSIGSAQKPGKVSSGSYVSDLFPVILRILR